MISELEVRNSITAQALDLDLMRANFETTFAKCGVSFGTPEGGILDIKMAANHVEKRNKLPRGGWFNKTRFACLP